MNWRDIIVKTSDLKLTSDYVDSGNLRVGDMVYTKDNLHDNSGDLKVKANQPYKVINLSKRYPGCFCIQTEVGPWWFFFAPDSPNGGGQYFYVKNNEQLSETPQEVVPTEEQKVMSPEDKEIYELSQFENIPTLLADIILKNKIFTRVKFLDYATNTYLKSKFGNDVQKMKENYDIARIKIAKALNFMAYHKYISTRPDKTLFVTNNGYEKIFG